MDVGLFLVGVDAGGLTASLFETFFRRVECSAQFRVCSTKKAVIISSAKSTALNSPSKAGSNFGAAATCSGVKLLKDRIQRVRKPTTE